MTHAAWSRILLGALISQLHGCITTPTTPPPSMDEHHAQGRTAAPQFGLHFFRDSVHTGYEYEPYWQAVRLLDPASAVVSFDETAVLAYEVDRSPSLCIAVRLKGRVAARVRKALADVREGPVLVTFDGAPLYAAREYPVHGAAALNYPVVHLEKLDRAEIDICAVQGAAFGGASEADAIRIDRPELRALFLAQGKLREVSHAGWWR